MSRVRRFFRGQVDFRVSGLPVTCLNKLRQFQISRVRTTGDVVEFSVPLAQAPAVRQVVSNFEWQARENRNLWRGLNFLLNRFVLTFSVLVALVAFLVLDTGIYRVRVLGADAALTDAVYAHLRSMGVDNFLWKRQVAELDLAENLVATFPSVAHVNVRVSGNTLLINLSTATARDQVTKADVCARYDAVVKKVLAYSGTAVVEAGDVVRKGDLLVRDAYPDSVVVIGEVAFVRGEEIVRLEILIS